MSIYSRNLFQPDKDTTLKNSNTRIYKKEMSFYERFAKPIFDFTLSVNILVVFSPIIVIIAILTKITSKGPILFRHKRVGINNTEFVIYKFRSMYVDAPAYSVKPNSSDDPCITPLGRWLRKASLDELPQFINVLKGDMSIVGPRPEMSFLVAEYDEWENQRHLVKPGITGLWQISEKRSKSIREGIHLDLEYVKTISLRTDIKILFKTLKVFVEWNTR